MSSGAPSLRPSPPGLTVSHILFAGHRGFRPIPENIDDHESTFSALCCKRQSHSFPRASCSATSASRFDALRLCVFASLRFSGVGSNAETQRGLGQDAVDSIGRERAIAQKPSARLLTDEPGRATDEPGFGKRGDHGEDTKALSLATRSFNWKVSFGNPCSIRVPSVARLKILSKMKDFFLK